MASSNGFDLLQFVSSGLAGCEDRSVGSLSHEVDRTTLLFPLLLSPRTDLTSAMAAAFIAFVVGSEAEGISIAAFAAVIVGFATEALATL